MNKSLRAVTSYTSLTQEVNCRI